MASLRIHIPARLSLWFLVPVFAVWGGCGLGSNKKSPKHEFRAVWVATVFNIDWPSSPGLSPSQQRTEFRSILDRQVANHMNAVIVQVRSASDLCYPSELEPWTKSLSGEQGKGPEPFYDPLAFMIEEAHRRNLEFHAWINPFRALTRVDTTGLSPDHVWMKSPQWCFTYGSAGYLDPGIPAVRRHVSRVVSDLVRRYDVDGIHFDDYFYPYPIPGQEFSAQDSGSYAKYGLAFRERDAWRRYNIDAFIRMVADSLSLIKPRVKLGVSPSPVWRNREADLRGSDTRVTYTTYDNLHADVRRWLNEGWIDYVAPQLYFDLDFPHASYENLLEWWATQRLDRHLYVGQAMFKVKEARQEAWKDASQLPRQLKINRSLSGVSGSIFFSANSFVDIPKPIQSRLRTEFYYAPALIPSMAWKDSIPPLAPASLKAEVDQQTVELYWQPSQPAKDGDRATYYIIYRSEGEDIPDLQNTDHILKVTRSARYLDQRVEAGRQYHYLVTAVDRLHNESRNGTDILLQIPESKIALKRGSNQTSGLD